MKAKEPLTIKPGPNNPVGLVWIDLSAPSYGIHGTPEPDKIGKTESHGLIRLTNWDALDLAGMVHKGTAVKSVDWIPQRGVAGCRIVVLDLLAPVYSWFTEGFDTLDLKEAKDCSTRYKPSRGWGTFLKGGAAAVGLLGGASSSSAQAAIKRLPIRPHQDFRSKITPRLNVFAPRFLQFRSELRRESRSYRSS